jgi:signal peptidase I
MAQPKTAPAAHPFVAWLWDWTKSIAVALLVWLVLRTFLIQAFRIPSGSMENTLLVGDFLFVNKALYGAEIPLVHRRLPAVREPQRNEILVFDGVEQPQIDIVKRMVGMPGDTLAMEGGQLIRNGERLDEPYVVHATPLPMAAPEQRLQMRRWQVNYLVGRDTATYNPDLQDWGPIVVPPDSFFMMGDSRDNSHDSRMWGFLPRNHVRGRPMFIYFSYDAGSWKPVPFVTAIRWARTFHRPS